MHDNPFENWNDFRSDIGEKIPIVPAFDEDGNQIPVHYVDGPVMQLTKEDKPPVCMGPDSGVHQEGVQWAYRKPDNAAIGGSVQWTAPRDLNGVTSSTDYGIWYNPVNFYYYIIPGSESIAPDFFQVDFSVGNSLRGNGWAMTYARPDLNDYNVKFLPAIPARAGSTYIIDAFLYNVPNTTESQFVVQITLEGVAGWVARYPLAYEHVTMGTDHIQKFQSFNDIYISGGGTAHEGVEDYTTGFALIHPSGTSRVRYLDGVFGLVPYEKIEPNPSNLDQLTYDILSAEAVNTRDRIGYQNLIDLYELARLNIDKQRQLHVLPSCNTVLQCISFAPLY